LTNLENPSSRGRNIYKKKKKKTKRRREKRRGTEKRNQRKGRGAARKINRQENSNTNFFFGGLGTVPFTGRVGETGLTVPAWGAEKRNHRTKEGYERHLGVGGGEKQGGVQQNVKKKTDTKRGVLAVDGPTLFAGPIRRVTPVKKKRTKMLKDYAKREKKKKFCRSRGGGGGKLGR